MTGMALQANDFTPNRPPPENRSAGRKVGQWLQRSPDGGRALPGQALAGPVPESVQQTIQSPGQALDLPTQMEMSERFGHDFSRVRVHADGQAAQSARAVDALAYTVGEHIVFGSGRYAPHTSAGRRLAAHELAHVAQAERSGEVGPASLDRATIAPAHSPNEQQAERMADAAANGRTIGETPNSVAALQRDPDEPTAKPTPVGVQSPYPEEQDVIRYAIGAKELAKLVDGTGLLNAKGWSAVGLSDSSFYAGPFTSDMGNFYYVYRFTGADAKASTYTLTRGTYISGWVVKEDLHDKLALVQGGQVLTVNASGLIPPTGGATPKPDKKEPGKGGQQPQPGQVEPGKPGGGEEPAKPEGGEEPAELTPQRKKWIVAGRENMKHEVNALFNEIEKVKEIRIGAWEKNANIKDPKPLKEALEVAVEIVGYGMGGVVGGLLTKAMAHGLAQEFAKEFLLKSTVKTAEAIFHHAIEPAEAFMAEATAKALKEGKEGNADVALATKSGLQDAYVEASRLQAVSEEHVQTREFNATVDSKYPDDVALADLVLVMEKLYDILFKDPGAFLRELSEGLIRLKDEVYLEERSEKYKGDREKMLKEDPHIHETEERSGNIRLGPMGDQAIAGIGRWGSPDYSFASFGGSATEVNTATLMALSGTPIKDLPLTLTFRFWATNPFSGLFQDVFCKVWFERRSDKSIWVDFDEDTPGMSVDNGIEWLASYASGLSRELSEAERRKYAPEGAKKVYEHVKDKPVINLSNTDLF
jgi:hypothetical protein